jgi:hypothetical protein
MTSTRLPAAAETGSTSWPWLALAADMAARRRSMATPGIPAAIPHEVRIATRIAARTPAAVARAREFTRVILGRWKLEASQDDVAVVVTELLTNAQSHTAPREAGWPVQVGLLQARPGIVLCAVSDPSTAPPVPQPPGRLGESGRGLHIVAGLSDFWGYVPRASQGKVVWAEFTMPAAR